MSTVWFITGSSRGLGRALATYALQKGDRVVATARSSDSLQDLVTTFGTKNLAVLQLDVANYEAARDVATKAHAVFGQIDIIINNAGYANVASIEDMDVEDFRQQVETNFFGVYNVSKAFIPILRKQQHGHIFQISSIGGRRASPGLCAYQASKWAVNGFSGILSAELAPFGINVTVLEPGLMRTDWAGSSMKRMPVTDGYQATVGRYLQMVEEITKDENYRGTETALVGDIILKLYELGASAALRMPMGEDAVGMAKVTVDALQASDAKWAELGSSVSGPK